MTFNPSGFNHDLLRPAPNSIKDVWLVMFREGHDDRPPTFFLSHGINFPKWDTEEKRRDGFRILGHVRSRQDAVIVCGEFNSRLKRKKKYRSYQTTSSKSKLILPKDYQ